MYEKLQNQERKSLSWQYWWWEDSAVGPAVGISVSILHKISIEAFLTIQYWYVLKKINIYNIYYKLAENGRRISTWLILTRKNCKHDKYRL